MKVQNIITTSPCSAFGVSNKIKEHLSGVNWKGLKRIFLGLLLRLHAIRGTEQIQEI
jgi:hypothetical protein